MPNPAGKEPKVRALRQQMKKIQGNEFKMSRTRQNTAKGCNLPNWPKGSDHMMKNKIDSLKQTNKQAKKN